MDVQSRAAPEGGGPVGRGCRTWRGTGVGASCVVGGPSVMTVELKQAGLISQRTRAEGICELCLNKLIPLTLLVSLLSPLQLWRN